jgi:hypothetical protein
MIELAPVLGVLAGGIGIADYRFPALVPRFDERH